MDELGKLILSICICVLTIVLFFALVIYTKKRTKRLSEVNCSIEDGNKDYFLNLKLKDGKYFPYFKELVSGFYFSIKSKGEEDAISKVKLKRFYRFHNERVIYIINNDLRYKKDIINIDGNDYLLIDKKIKTIEMLISNDKPSHFMLKYTFNKKDEGFEMNVEEVDYNEKQ